ERASTCAGVGKSGSPAPNPITSSPAVLSAFALASTASVADSAMAATRAEMRCSGMRRWPPWRLGRTPHRLGGGASSGHDPPATRHHPARTAPRPPPPAPTPPPPIPLPARPPPRDGRFGSGPSKVRPQAVADLAAAAPTYLGTSHRQAGVRGMVGRLRAGLA